MMDYLLALKGTKKENIDGEYLMLIKKAFPRIIPGIAEEDRR